MPKREGPILLIVVRYKASSFFLVNTIPYSSSHFPGATAPGHHYPHSWIKEPKKQQKASNMSKKQTEEMKVL
jgi:hypothetical protein